eukprot:gene40-55_t
MGIASGYASWCPTYALEVGVATSYQDAAYVIAIFSGALTFGRLLAVFVAMRYSATIMLKVQLVVLVASGIVLVIIAGDSYIELCIASALLGFGISSMFGLAMTVQTDYGYAMDAATTTTFMIGTTLGDAILPVVVGYLMQYTGDDSLLVGLVSGSGVVVKTAAESAQTELSHSVHVIRRKKVELQAEYALSQSMHASRMHNESSLSI